MAWSATRRTPTGSIHGRDEEIARFEKHHGAASKAVLALRLILCTGAARQDVIRIGWQNVQASRIAYRRGKTAGEVDLPILGELLDVLESVPTNRMLFLTHSGSRPYKATTFGNWFHDQCIAAGLPHCSSHGLRKAGATRLANAGATEFEIMAFLGHKTTDEARTYTKKANRKTPVRQRAGEGGEGKKGTSIVQPCQKVGHRSARNTLKRQSNQKAVVRPRGIEPLLPP